MSGVAGNGLGELVVMPPGDKDVRSGERVEGSLLPFQTQMIEHIMKSTSNEIMFLPTGLGEGEVVNAVIRRKLSAHPSKHIVLCAARPGQVLSRAARLQRYFDSEGIVARVGAYCGGDFLYDFPKEFAENQVLVFTAGLLMRLTKLGVYSLDRCSLMVLHDAFYAIRNHPMNTLVREYYWKIEKDRPKLLGTMLPQTHALQRPFDKLRQSVRRLSHSAQSGICLPAGHALESLASRIHHSHIAIHAYNVTQEEEKLITLIQKHFLHVWDVLHEHKQNHFGRLIHFPAVSAKEGGHDMENTSDVVDPFHHDWEQILIMVKHSIEFARNLPESGSDHVKNHVALLILNHVLSCVESVLKCMASGTAPAIDMLYASIVDFQSKLVAASSMYSNNLSDKVEGNPEYLLLRDLTDVLGSSPLLQHLGASSLEDLDMSALQREFMTSQAPSRIEKLKLLINQIGYSFHCLKDNDDDSTACIVVSDQESAHSLKKHLHHVVSPENMVLWSGDVDAFSPGNVVFITESNALSKSTRLLMKEKATDVIWFSPNSVMHASAFDYDSNALSVLRQICGVGDIDVQSSARNGPKCHVIATKEQSLAWIDISKADQMLLAAAQFVSSGDASLEESLSQLALGGKSMFSNHGVSSALSVAIPSPSTILHLICLGLCGKPPLFHLHPVSRGAHHREDSWQATAVLPQNLVIELAASQPSARLRGSTMEPFVGQLAESSSEARDAAAEAAISYLTLSSTVSAYWQTRTLLDLVSKVPSSLHQDQRKGIEARTRTTMPATVPASPFSTQVYPSEAALDNENLICSICGIVTTSMAHLHEHEKGRRHMKNLARLQQEQKANMPQAKYRANSEDPESSSHVEMPSNTDFNNIDHSNTIEKLPSSLSDAMARRNSQPLRQNSNVFENFPCVRVGEYALPSSMDLRAFLEEMEIKEDARTEASPRHNFSSEKSPRDTKKSPKHTPRNTSRQKSGWQSTPRDHGKSRGSPIMEPAGHYAYHMPVEFGPNYGMLVNEAYHSDPGMYQYGPYSYLPFVPQPAMIPPQMMHSTFMSANNHMMPGYVPGMMIPSHEIVHEHDHSTRPRQQKRNPPQTRNKK